MKKVFILLFNAIVIATYAQTHDLAKGMEIHAEACVTTSTGSHAPLWLSANRQGKISPHSSSAYEEICMTRSTDADSMRQWHYGYGLDVQLNQHGQSALFIQQAYAEIGWEKLLFSIGQKERKTETTNAELSSGSQTLGINARPVPQVRISLEEYVPIPLGGRWVGVKGHVAYGKTTDDSWQKEFTAQKQRYTEHTLYHSKAGYMKIEKPGSPLSIRLGIEMAAQFGGASLMPQSDGNVLRIEGEGGIKGMWHVFIPGGGESTDKDKYKNASGNTLGSWLMRIDYRKNGSTWSLYADKFFEDQSSMFNLDYDGYETGSNWREKKKSRFVLYDFKDWLIGGEWHQDNGLVNNVVAEYIYTRYQGGPINHDNTAEVSDHVAGRDNFYNHQNYTGWQHWGQVIGNPLYLSPIYNERDIYVSCNRFHGVHLGIGGNISSRMTYRILMSWQKGWGTYERPFPDPRESTTAMAELSFNNFRMIGMEGWRVVGAFAFDRGSLRGNTTGLQLRIVKSILQ